MRLGQRAVDQVRRDEWNAHDRSHTKTGKWIKGTRWSLLKAPDKQSVRQLALLGEVAHANKAMFRAFLMKEELRLLYQLEDPALAPAHLDAWLAWASTITPAAVRQARTHDPPPPRRDPRRDPTRPLQRPPRGPQQPHPPHQPPQLRLSLRPAAHRPRLPLLLGDRHRPTALNLTHNSTGAPDVYRCPRPRRIRRSSSVRPCKCSKAAAGRSRTGQGARRVAAVAPKLGVAA